MSDSSTEWQFSKTSLTERTAYLLDNEAWTDCSFLLETAGVKKLCKAHKVFLAMSSPVFEQILYGPLADKFPVKIEGIHPDDFQLFLKYIYTGSITLDCFEDACHVYLIADKYMIPDLQQVCVNRIWDLLRPEISCQVYEFAKQIGNEELEEECLKIMSSDTNKIIDDPSFETLHISTLEKMLDMDYLTVPSELELFKAVTRWAESECERKRTELSSPLEAESITPRSVSMTLLSKIRFLTLQAEDIATGIGNSNLINQAEILAFFFNVLSSNPAQPMPPEFCTSKSMRCSIKKSKDHDQLSSFYSVEVRNLQTGSGHLCYIYLMVKKKIELVGVQMNPDREPHRSLHSHSSSPFGYGMRESSSREGMFVELRTKSGTLISSSFLNPLPRTASIIKLNGDYIFDRTEHYVMRIETFTGGNLIMQNVDSAFTSQQMENTIVYNVEGGPIKTDVKAAEYQLEDLWCDRKLREVEN